MSFQSVNHDCTDQLNCLKYAQYFYTWSFPNLAGRLFSKTRRDNWMTNSNLTKIIHDFNHKYLTRDQKKLVHFCKTKKNWRTHEYTWRTLERKGNEVVFVFKGHYRTPTTRGLINRLGTWFQAGKRIGIQNRMHNNYTVWRIFTANFPFRAFYKVWRTLRLVPFLNHRRKFLNNSRKALFALETFPRLTAPTTLHWWTNLNWTKPFEIRDAATTRDTGNEQGNDVDTTGLKHLSTNRLRPNGDARDRKGSAGEKRGKWIAVNKFSNGASTSLTRTWLSGEITWCEV